MNTVKDGYDVIKSLRPAPVDQTNVLEDRILDLLFDGSRYVQENHKAVGFIYSLPTLPLFTTTALPSLLFQTTVQKRRLMHGLFRLSTLSMSSVWMR